MLVVLVNEIVADSIKPVKGVTREIRRVSMLFALKVAWLSSNITVVLVCCVVVLNVMLNHPLVPLPNELLELEYRVKPKF